MGTIHRMSEAAMDEGLDRSIGCGYGQSGAALHPLPILVCQYRACSKDIFIGGATVVSERSE